MDNSFLIIILLIILVIIAIYFIGFSMHDSVTIPDKNEGFDNDTLGEYAGNNNIGEISGGSKPPCNLHEKLDPSDLLPEDSDLNWDQFKSIDDDLKNNNLLEAGFHIGQQTQVNKNPNLQLRSEPTIPKSSVSPWNQSSVNHEDGARKPLDPSFD